MARGASTDSSPSCFVCEEPGGTLLAVCNCRGRYLHVSCQRKLIARAPAHANGCAVCKAPYANVVMTTRTRLSRAARPFASVCVPFMLTIIAVEFCLGLVWFVVGYVIDKDINDLVVSVSVMGFTALMVAGLCAALFFCPHVLKVVERRPEARCLQDRRFRAPITPAATEATASTAAAVAMPPARRSERAASPSESTAPPISAAAEPTELTPVVRVFDIGARDDDQTEESSSSPAAAAFAHWRRHAEATVTPLTVNLVAAESAADDVSGSAGSASSDGYSSASDDSGRQTPPIDAQLMTYILNSPESC